MSDLADTLLDIPAFFDPINRIEGVVCTFYFANWKKARQGGPLGILLEFLSAVVGYSAPTILVRRNAMSGQQIEQLLMRHGIKLWDRGLKDRYTLYFCVKRRQVAWAEYLLERAGLELLSQHDPNARRYGANARKKGLTREPPFKKAVSKWDSIRTELVACAIGGTGLLILFVLAWWLWLR
jgi:hypothetical protein